MRLRHWLEERRAKTDHFRYWLYFKSWKWILAVLAAYFAAAYKIGFGEAWEILVGRKSATDAAWPWASWPLSVLGWLLVPAFVGGVAGFVVTAQLERRRSESPAEATSRLVDEAGTPGPPHQGPR